MLGAVEAARRAAAARAEVVLLALLAVEEQARQRGVEVADQAAGEVAPRLAVGAALALRRGVGLEQVGDARLPGQRRPVDRLPDDLLPVVRDDEPDVARQRRQLELVVAAVGDGRRPGSRLGSGAAPTCRAGAPSSAAAAAAAARRPSFVRRSSFFAGFFASFLAAGFFGFAAAAFFRRGGGGAGSTTSAGAGGGGAAAGAGRPTFGGG